ncbi:GSCFA domain-containing protein [Adhaeribacter soli]|uniref:GSCFA domain-containing protein n=1 Tax=Adhaeribacter soli TaxID=2607655 RepID=A0A5N1IML7_9BACT|nr:GSCFA domain-containing protein [Adhaeribacter soli]KAA9325984.1 hypothetical protein F0P94_16315 [Adhaeribacter soli]
MIFRTELHPSPADQKLDLTSKAVTVGSCFSEVIGRQLEKYKVNTLSNPFGTIFNPLSACKLLQVCAGADIELADSFVENNGRWYSYDFHSSFSAPTEEDLYEQLDEVIVKTRRFLKQADVLILTLGTANIFRLNITGETVANCHKLPAANFTRETLLPEEIITAIAETHSLLRELNPNLRLVLTVSPVRHIKDTLELNSVSKAVLRLATHYLSQQLPFVSYFPAYELLIDDLRDYRFYKEDMLHPTATAEQYIWEKFSGAYFEETFHLFAQEWEKILRAREHKPFHPESPQHQAFLQNIIEKLHTLQEKTDVTEELAYFESQVIVLPEVVEEPDSEEEEEEAELTPEEAQETAATVETALAETSDEEEDIATPVMVAVPEEAVALEEGSRKKKKRKPKRKKKKPFGTEEAQPIAEAAAAESVIAIDQEEASATETTPVVESTPELGTVLEETAEPVVATLAAAFTEPTGATLSKSAKKRAARKKKKALAAQQTSEEAMVQEQVAPIEEESIAETETPLEIAPSEPVLTIPVPVEEVEPVPFQATEAEPTPAPAPSASAKGRKEKQPKKTAAKGKKKEWPDLFAPAIPAEAAPVEVPALTEAPEPEPEVNPLLEILSDWENIPMPTAPKRRGRPKKEEPAKVEAPVPAATPVTPEPVQTEVLPTETVTPEPASVPVSETAEETTVATEQPKKKRTYNRKPKPETTSAPAPTPAPKGRRKKATPEG